MEPCGLCWWTPREHPSTTNIRLRILHPAEQTKREWKGLSWKCPPRFLRSPTSSPPPLSNMHFSSNFLPLPPLPVSLHSSSSIPGYSTAMATGDVAALAEIADLSVSLSLSHTRTHCILNDTSRNRRQTSSQQEGWGKKCESVWPFQLAGLQMEELTPTDILTPSKPPPHIHLLKKYRRRLQNIVK